MKRIKFSRLSGIRMVHFKWDDPINRTITYFADDEAISPPCQPLSPALHVLLTQKDQLDHDAREVKP